MSKTDFEELASKNRNNPGISAKEIAQLGGADDGKGAMSASETSDWDQLSAQLRADQEGAEIIDQLQQASVLVSEQAGSGPADASDGSNPIDRFNRENLGLVSDRQSAEEAKNNAGQFRPTVGGAPKSDQNGQSEDRSSGGRSSGGSSTDSEAATLGGFINAERQRQIEENQRRLAEAKSQKIGRFNLTGRAKNKVRIFLLGSLVAIMLAVPIGIIGMIPHAIQNWIENRVGEYTERAVDKFGQRVLYSFIKNRVAIDKCKGAYNAAGNASGVAVCRPRVNERDSRLSQLFNDWHAADMEGKLVERGINVEYDPGELQAGGSGKPYKITIDRPESEGGNFTASGEFGVPDIDTAEFVGKREASAALRKEIKTVLKEDTRWWQYLKRRNLKAGYLRDLGLPARVFPNKKVAKALDDFDAVKATGKSRFRQYLTKWVVSKGDGRLGLMLELLFSGDSAKASPAELRKSNKALALAAEKLGVEKVDKLIAKYAGKNLQEIELELFKSLMERLFKQIGQQIGESATKAIPVVGWIMLALTVLDLLDMATDHSLQYFLSAMNTGAMLDVSNMMDTTVSEEKRGFVDASSAGDMRLTLISGLGASRVFSNLVGYNSPSGKKASGYNCRPNISLTDMSSFLGAADQIFGQGDPTAVSQVGMSDGEDVCENHRVDYDPLSAFNTAFDLLQDGVGPWGGLSTYTTACILTELATPGSNQTIPKCPSIQESYHALKGGIAWISERFGFLTNWIANIPQIRWLIGNVTGWITNATTILLTGQSLVGPQMLSGGLGTDTKSGARIVDAWYGGGSATQNAFAKGSGDGGGLGGIPITPTQAAKLNDSIAQERKSELASSSIFERMFDISHADTAISGTVGMAFAEGGIQNIVNPMTNIAMAFKSASTSAFADSADQQNCSKQNDKGQAVNEFGVICYSYTDDMIDSLSDDDLDKYSDPEFCDSYSSAIDAKRKQAEDSNDYSKKDPDGTGTSTEPDYCRAMCTVTDTMGTEFRTDDPICGFENLAGTTTSDNISGDQTAGEVNTSADYQELATSILNSGRVSFDKDVDKRDIETGFGSCGNGAGERTALSIKTLRLIDYILNNTSASLRFGAIISGHRCNKALHPKGLAIDIGNEEVAGVVMPKVFAARQQLGINEMFFNGSGVEQYTMTDGQSRPGLKVDGHNDHIHIGVNP